MAICSTSWGSVSHWLSEIGHELTHPKAGTWNSLLGSLVIQAFLYSFRLQSLNILCYSGKWGPWHRVTVLSVSAQGLWASFKASLESNGHKCQEGCKGSIYTSLLVTVCRALEVGILRLLPPLIPLLIPTHGNFCSKMETTNDAVAETVWNTRITTFPNSSTQIIHSRQLLLRFSLLQQWLPKKKAEPKAAGIVINLQTAPAFLRESEHCFRVYLSSGNAWIQASLSRDLPAQAEEVDNPSWRNGCVAHLLPCSCGIALSWP